MQGDRIKWNRKFLNESYPTEPSEIVVKYSELAEKGTALDIASGNGRNALYLARNGFAVDALDISDEGLKKFVGCHPMVRAACIDLDGYDLPRGRYSLILNIRYLHRSLMPRITAALTPGGMLIFETYLRRPDFMPQRPFCPEHLLEINELRDSFSSLEVIYYREAFTPSGDAPYPLASLVALNR